MNVEQWRVLVYGEGHHGPQPEAAEQALRERPELAREDPHAAGVYSPDPPTSGRPAIAALTHSSLSRLRPQDFAACVRRLIDEGAAVNAGLALYGAAGKNFQPELTGMLLAAGADPNDGESVYHAAGSFDHRCLRLLLAAGASLKGTNSINHSLDRNDLACTRLLLEHGADPNEGHIPPLFWAIRRRRSLAHVEALLDAGAEARAVLHDVTPYRMALLFGLREIAARLAAVTGETPKPEDAFAAACSRADRAEAERLKAANPRVVEDLPTAMLRLLPDAVEAGNTAGAKLMVELGWPIQARGGDWKATALNLAVFRGDAGLTRFLCQHGATWLESHGFGDNVLGTLSYASVERPFPFGDWAACAKALVEECGMPVPEPGFKQFSAEVEAYFTSQRSSA